jgi:CubicO group peptidase (beta-lactamase class C family)
MSRLLSVVGLMIPAVFGLPQTSTPPTRMALASQLDQVDSIIGKEFAKRPIGSVTVGVVSGTTLIWSKSYGYADIERKMPADSDTVYRVGSITKMFTALMLAQMVDTQQIRLTDPVEKYLPEVNMIQYRSTLAPPITLVQLATHTAGLAAFPENRLNYFRRPVSDWEADLFAALRDTRYDFEPGTRFAYSNIGYAVLGAALSHAVDQPYTEYVQHRIFEALQMTSSGFELSASMKPHLANGYRVQGDSISSEISDREHLGAGFRYPNGAAYTSLRDLARFASFELGLGPEAVLKTESLERMFGEKAFPGSGFTYGRGYKVVARERYNAIGHDGSYVGYLSAFFMNRKLGIAVIVLANTDGVLDPTQLALQCLDTLS